MLRKGLLIGGGTIAVISGAVTGSMIESSKRKQVVQPERFDKLALKYDKEVGASELHIGIEKYRQQLIEKAHGRVLETCAGTGRNHGFYDGKKVTELILVDASREMLAEAAKKPLADNIQVKAIRAKTLEAFADEQFDTVVDTFGLCSVEEPQEYLKNMKRVLRKGGTALFMEHGRAENDSLTAKLMNFWLDFRAASRADYFGCLWNREVGKLIENSGFLIVNKKVTDYGTCTWIEAKKI